jgi:hypothetical protein
MPNLYTELELTFVPTDRGGRSKMPRLDDQGYRPHLRVAPRSAMLDVQFVDGPEGPAPLGVPIRTTVRCLSDGVSYDDLMVGAQVEVLEGPFVVARGTVIRR